MKKQTNTPRKKRSVKNKNEDRASKPSAGLAGLADDLEEVIELVSDQGDTIAYLELTANNLRHEIAQLQQELKTRNRNVETVTSFLVDLSQRGQLRRFDFNSKVLIRELDRAMGINRQEKPL